MDALERELHSEWMRRFGDGRSPIERYCPEPPSEKQQIALDSDAFELLYGGSAGGGKSSWLLMESLRHVDVPGYAALLLRRTYKDLALPGAIMDRSHKWLQGTDAHWDGLEKRWVFPSGAVIQFGYLDTERDKYRYQSAEFQFCGYDELTQFTEPMYTYLMTRLRRKAGVDIPLRMRAASNPGGVGHFWVKDRFLDKPGDRVFVAARLEDNPGVDQDAYRGALHRVDETTRRQLLEGEWIIDAGELIYPYDDLRNGIDVFPAEGKWHRVLGIDLGASAVKPTTAFVRLAFCYEKPDIIIVEHAFAEAALTPTDIAQHISAQFEAYEGMRIVVDAGALGAGYVREFRERHALPAEPARKQDKLAFRQLIKGDIERGVLKVYRPGARPVLDEMRKLRFDEKGLDNDAKDDDHYCLPSSVLVETVMGPRSIADVRVGDIVMTRVGPRAVVASGCTGMGRLWTVETESGARLHGTSNHPVMTQRGMVRIDQLRTDDYVTTLCASMSKHSAASPTGATLILRGRSSASISWLEAVAVSIAPSGRSIAGLFRRGITSITLMAIHSITESQTSSASLQESICEGTWPTRRKRRRSDNHSKSTLSQKPQSGIAHPKAGPGTPNTQGVRQKTEHRPGLFARFAGVGSSRKRERPRLALWPAWRNVGDSAERIIQRWFVRGAAKRSTETSTSGKNFVPVRVSRVTQTQIVEPVYNLTVENQHEYFANGILVSNSDAMLYAWREAKHWLAEAPEKLPKPGTREAAEHWVKQQESEELEAFEDGEKDWWE